VGHFAFGFVGRTFDFGVEAFQETLEKGVPISLLVLQFVSKGDVAGEVGEDYSPSEGVFPGAAADADVLALFGDPYTEYFERGLVALGDGWDAQGFFRTHVGYLLLSRL
jgi:hypothetical protein